MCGGGQRHPREVRLLTGAGRRSSPGHRARVRGGPREGVPDASPCGRPLPAATDDWVRPRQRRGERVEWH